MRYILIFLLLCAVAIPSLSTAAARPWNYTRIAVRGTISATDTAGNTITVTPPAPPAGSKFLAPSPVTFSVTSTTKISLDGNAADISALSIGDLCMAELVKAADGTLSAIRVTAITPFVVGTLTATDSATLLITVQPPSPPWAKTQVPAIQFQVIDSTTILKNGPAAFDDLLQNDTVKVSYLPAADPTAPPTAIQVEVLPEYFSGKVIAVDSSLGTIGVQGFKTTLSFSVDPNATIVRAWKKASLGDFQVGDLAEVTYFQTINGPLAVDIVATPSKPIGPGIHRR